MTALDRLAEWADAEARRRMESLSEAAQIVYGRGGILRVTDEGVEAIGPRDFYIHAPEPPTSA
jgi:hypothetical protein